MKNALAILATAGVVGVAAVAAPAPAEAHGLGRGLAFGPAAGAIAAGVYAATNPYYYGPYGYDDYYGPRVYYAPGPYEAYYGGPVYYHRYHHWRSRDYWLRWNVNHAA
jgi:hypothetical protein